MVEDRKPPQEQPSDTGGFLGLDDSELKENDLYRTLTEGWGPKADKYGSYVALLVLVVAIVFLGWRGWGYFSTGWQEDSLTDLAVETTPAGFERIANDYSNPAIKARALLAGGDTALDEAIRIDPQAEAEVWAQTLDEAEKLYQRVVASSAGDVYVVNARLGLASVAESRQQWDAAREHYDAAIAAAEPTLGFLAAIARERSAMLAALSQPIALAPDPPATATDANPSLDSALPGLDLPSFDAALPETDAPAAGTFDFDAMLDDAAGGISVPGLDGLDTEADTADEPQP
ncbi:MAG: hypothetical protein AAGB29_05820 [Planctomycetota bacterium]